MSPKLRWKDRILDVVIFAVLGLLVFDGYSRATNYFSRTPTLGVELPLIVFCAFIAILYPFRIHTRAVWIFLAPLSLFVAPVIGAHLFHRLRFAPGLQEQLKIMEIPIFLFLFVAFCIVWLIPAYFGWQLRRPREQSQGRSADLKELFVMTAIVCVMLILFREAFDLESLTARPRAQSWQLLSAFAIRQFLVYGICIWVGLTFHWSICILVACFAVGVESYFEWLSLSRIQFAGYAPRTLWSVAESRIWNVGSVLALVAAVRVAGYRIQRDTQLVPR